MKLSDVPDDILWIKTIDPNFELQPIVRPTPKPLQEFGGIPISIRWFANWQRAATFTLDIELDWGPDPVFMIEFVFGIGFQVGFALVVSR